MDYLVKIQPVQTGLFDHFWTGVNTLWAKKDLGLWSIAKGEYEEGEDPFQAALREFYEETGHRPPGPFLPLTGRRQPSGKLLMYGLLKVSAIPSAWFQIHLGWNGRRGLGDSRSFPR